MATRSLSIRDRILRKVGKSDVQPEVIYDTLTEISRQIAEECLCIEKTSTITLTSGVANEPSGFYRGKLIKLPSNRLVQMEEIDITKFDEITRNSIVSDQRPIYFKRWGGQFTFYPTPGNGSYTIYYYGTPTTTMSDTVNPETPQLFDKALWFAGVMDAAETLGMMDLLKTYALYFENELERSKRAWRRTKSEHHVIVPRDF